MSINSTKESLYTHMTITLPADFIQTLFPQTAGNKETLTQQLKQFYTVGATEPTVEIEDSAS